MSKPNPVVHFEMPADDITRMSKFYTDVFHWQIQSMDGEYGNYVIATTTRTGDDGRPSEPGAINGGFYSKSDSPAKHPSFVIAVDDIDAFITKIKDAGGEVHGEPVDIPNVGRYVSFTDTEGNRLSILKPRM